MIGFSMMRGASMAMLLFFVFAMVVFLPTIAVAGSTAPGPGNRVVEVDNPLGSVSSVPKFLSDVFRGAVTLFTPLAVFFIVLAGFQFVYARGNPDSLKRARSNLMYVIIGVGLFLGAWAIAELLAATLKQLGA